MKTQKHIPLRLAQKTVAELGSDKAKASAENKRLRAALADISNLAANLMDAARGAKLPIDRASEIRLAKALALVSDQMRHGMTAAVHSEIIKEARARVAMAG